MRLIYRKSYHHGHSQSRLFEPWRVGPSPKPVKASYRCLALQGELVWTSHSTGYNRTATPTRERCPPFIICTLVTSTSARAPAFVRRLDRELALADAPEPPPRRRGTYPFAQDRPSGARRRRGCLWAKAMARCGLADLSPGDRNVARLSENRCRLPGLRHFRDGSRFRGLSAWAVVVDAAVVGGVAA